MVSYSFFKLTYTLGMAVPTRHRWPLGAEGKQAKKIWGVSGPPPYPVVEVGRGVFAFWLGAFPAAAASPTRTAGRALGCQEEHAQFRF